MASIQYVVNATDAASSVFAKIALSADGLDKQLEDLGKRVAEPEVDLKDAAFTTGMINAAKRIDKLSAMMATPGANLEDGKFQAEILKINAQLDRLDKRHVTATVDVNVDRSFLSRIRGLFGGGGAAGGISAAGATAGAGGQGFGGLLGALGPIGQGVAIGGGILGLATLLPALLPAALGGLVGGGAAGGAFLLGSAANKQLVALQKSLASAKGPAKGPIQAQIKALQQTSGPELAIFGAFQDLGAAAKGTFAGALKAPGPGFSAGGGQPGAPSFLTSLMGILKQVAGFTKTLQPMLGDLFRAGAPYLKLFVGFLEQATKTLLPVFTNLLKEMTPYLPVIGQGLMIIVNGFAGFLNALGPSGMQASAKIFVFFAKVMAAVLVAFGHTIEWLTENVPKWVHDIAKWWDWMRHHTATVFDGIRHDIAHYWDMIFQNSIGMVIRLVHNIETQYNSLRHGIASTFDGARHDIASAWDTIWNNTVSRVQRGISDVIGWFKGLPGRALNALFGFGHSLYAFGHAALNDFLSGLKSIGGTVLGWLRNFIGGIPGAIMKFLHMSPPHAGSVFFDLGANIMHHLASGIKATAHQAVNAAAGAARRVSAAGSGVQRWAGLVSRALRMEGLSPGLAGNVLYQMQTESGGNPNAINLNDINAQMGDPSRGLMQVIGSTFQAYHWPGTSWNIYDELANVAAALNYARHVYGPSLMSGGMGIGSGHGYALGSWSVPYTGPALVHQGEMIIPAGAAAAVRSGGGGITVNVNVSPLSSPAETGRKVAEVLAEFKKRGGMVYAPGGF